jgi:ABC-type sugar transport system permease subunit
MRKKKMGMITKRSLTGLVFVFPWIIGFFIFFLNPLVQSITFGLNNVVITAKGRKLQFVGMGNFRDIFTKDAYFVDRLVNFLKDILLQLPLILVFSLMIAILLNQQIRCKGLFRTLFFLPIIVVSGPVLSMLMNSGSATIPLIEQYGVYELINDAVPKFLQEPVTGLLSELLLILWYSGVPTLIFFAGLQKIDISLYEASYMDGASSWVSFWKIVLPAIKGMILINSIYVTVFLATSELNEVIILIRSNMLDASKGFGIASAMAWIYTVCILLLILLCYLLFGRESKTKVYHYEPPRKKRRKSYAKR